MATSSSRSKAPLSTSAMGALVFGFFFAPLALYFGLRTFEETKPGDANRIWASAGIVLAALQVFTLIAIVVSSAVMMKYGVTYWAPGQYPMPYYDEPMMPHRMMA